LIKKGLTERVKENTMSGTKGGKSRVKKEETPTYKRAGLFSRKGKTERGNETAGKRGGKWTPHLQRPEGKNET